MASAPRRRIVIFSGGTAANSLVDVFNEVGRSNNCSLTYVIPISDNGGSSSELIRVFGGPGIGDVRSMDGRLVRLIPSTHTYVFNLFNHRLSSSADSAAADFLTLLTGNSPLYAHMPTAQSMLIRSILSHLHLEILKRTRPPSSTFNFQSASIGNLFLTGARLFSGSFESAIYLLALIGGVDESRTGVLPVILSNFSHHISAGLANGDVIVGQNSISHPNEPTALNHQTYKGDPNGTTSQYSTANNSVSGGDTPPATGSLLGEDSAVEDSEDYAENEFVDEDDEDNTLEDATLPGSLRTLRKSAIVFSKEAEAPLPARIERIWYINPYGQEMRPTPNPKVVDALQTADAVIYSIGSLYTSIVPSLVVRSVGAQIARSSSNGSGSSNKHRNASGSRGPRFKILILNGTLDRETPKYTAADFLDAITRACIESRSGGGGGGGGANTRLAPGEPLDRTQWTEYVTHLIHLEGEGTPKVDKAELSRYGVEVLRLYGRKADAGGASATARGGGGRYDPTALTQALSAILGKRERSERARRQTLESRA